MKKRSNRGYLLGAAALLLWCLTLSLVARLGDLTGSVSFRWAEGEGISPAAVLRQEKIAREDQMEEIPEIALWKLKAETSVSNQEENREATTQLFSVFGTAQLIAEAPLLSGAYPARSDADGCTVSKGLAEAIWGNTQVLGLAIRLDEKLYYVRGVSEAAENQLLVQLEGDDQQLCENLQIVFPGKTTMAKAEDYLSAAGWAPTERFNAPILQWLLDALAHLPQFALAALILISLGARMWQLRYYKHLLLGYLPLGLGGSVLALFALGRLNIPAELIPTKWSDFEFWQRLFSGAASQWSGWFAQQRAGRDTTILYLTMAVLLLLAIALPLILAACKKMQITTLEESVATCIGILLVIHLGTKLSGGIGAINWSMRAYAMPCIWCLISYLQHRHTAYLQPEKPAEGEAST